MSWLQKLTTPKIRTEGTAGRGKVPEGVWEKCSGCGIGLYRPELERNLMVCPKCGHHHPISARARLTAFLDEGGNELDAGMGPVDALKFKDSKKYRDRILAAQKATGEKDALVSIEGSVKGMPVVACAFEFSYMGGSMGSVVGEKITRAAEAALRGKASFICFTATGGARMQEGLQSLLQMAKTSAALARLRKAGLPYIVVLTHPTTGGVAASFALLGDIIIAEPNALVGFAGPRVIEQTIRQKLPPGFQTAEFLLQHGMIDGVVPRRELRPTVTRLFRLYKG